MTTRFNCNCVSVILFCLLSIGVEWQAIAGSNQTTPSKTGSGSAGSGGLETQPSGEQIWSMNCKRCHNLLPPTMYNPAQWDVIVHHMRLRANLTGAEQRAIQEFLRSASR